MSGENVDLHTLAKGVEAFNRRDLPVVLGFFHRDAVLTEDPDFSPNPATYRGWVEIARYWESFDRAWTNLRVEIEGVRFARDTAVGLVRFRAVGRISGVPIETPAALVCVMNDGKVSRMELRLDQRKALEAVGLRE